MAVTIENRSTVYGLERGQIKWLDDFTASEDENGIVTLTLSFICYLDEFFSVVPQINSPCQLKGWETIGLTSRKITELNGGIATVNCTYGGVNEASFEFGQSRDSYEASNYTTEEPIESHKNYKDVSNKDIQVFQNVRSGAWKQVDGALKFYDADIGEKSVEPYEVTDPAAMELWDKFLSKGIETYLCPHQTFRVTNIRKTIPSGLFDKVGKIDNPPSKCPSLEEGMNWLYNGASISQQGNVYTITKEWIASGPGGWMTEIY